MKTYLVTAKPKNPAFDDGGYQVEITAKNKAEAISDARARVRRECVYDRHDGPIKYSTEEV